MRENKLVRRCLNWKKVIDYDVNRLELFEKFEDIQSISIKPSEHLWKNAESEVFSEFITFSFYFFEVLANDILIVIGDNTER